MASGSEFYRHVNHPKEIGELLTILCEPGGASLALESAPELSLPVVVETATIGAELCLDLSAIRNKASVQTLADGEAFRVLGGGQRGLVRTPVLTAERVWEQNGKLYCETPFPGHLEQLQRRDTFRAELRQGMRVRVELHVDNTILTGWLRDLSITGCLVELEASAAWKLDEHVGPLNLEMTFPDGSHFMAPANAHHKAIKDGSVLCGFSLQLTSKEQQQQMWFMVHETEREAARSAQSDHEGLRPSPLYRGSAHEIEQNPSHNTYELPMARRLAHCANWLTTLNLRLRQGESIDSKLLSQQSEYLLSLLDRDRNALLYALTCMHKEPPLVQHCLAVAVRLVDMTAGLSLPPTMRKALAATALVHDLGKELLPTPLRKSKRLDGDQYQQFQQHVPLILERLQTCQWIAPAAVEAVVEGANERLDGSGYPKQRDAEQQNQLMRLTAVVDVADAMGRDRADRDGVAPDQIYRHLLRYPGKFDQRWARLYVKRYGLWPIGSLVRHADGQLAWILSLDDNGQPASVREIAEISSPDSNDGTVLSAGELDTLGKPVEILPVSAYS